MKIRQAKKIMKQAKGGKTRQLNLYWWWRIVDVLKGINRDHRVIQAINITGYGREILQ